MLSRLRGFVAGKFTLSQEELAARYRGYWEKYRGLSHEERWFATLMDDHATPEQWAEAAGNIVRPESVRSHYYFCYQEEVPQPGDKLTPLGGPLRAKQNPSLSALLARRITELANGNDTHTIPNRQLDMGFTLAKVLVRWDGGATAALPALKTLSAGYQQCFAD